ncbi:MAG: HEPN family nuclease [Candidatus Sulfotelmatobacter sp.]
MPFITRNDPLGFAGFAWKNFEFIERTANNSPDAPDIHPVTQLVLSMLGLIVFQREKNRIQYGKDIRQTTLDTPDWPQWAAMSPHCNTLEELVNNLRHAVAHGHVEFSSNSHDLSEVEISFRNPGKQWSGSIRADALRAFCFRFKALLEAAQ